MYGQGFKQPTFVFQSNTQESENSYVMTQLLLS